MPHLITVEASGRIIRVLVYDWMDVEAYEHVVPYIDAAIFEYDSARILFDLTKYAGREPGAVFEDVQLSLPNWSKVERVAILGHKHFEPRVEWFCKPFTSATVKFFYPNQKNAAEEWIREGIA